MPIAYKKEPTPYWRSECGRATIYVGDCRDVMAQLTADQFHAVVTDPPYDLTDCHTGGKAIPGKFGERTEAQKLERKAENKRGGFMGKKWDGTGVAFDPVTWERTISVAKPGAHLLSFGGTRTWHRMACAIEDVGWVIRDTIMWVYGSGFPKSHDVSKAIDKELGAERDRMDFAQSDTWREKEDRDDRQSTIPNDEPVTDAAHQWNGWGTALKPGYEPVILARKPLACTVAQCVMKHGTGGLNIDGCRIEAAEGDYDHTGNSEKSTTQNFGWASLNGTDSAIHKQGKPHALGRWPANLILSYLDDQYELCDDVTPEQLRQLADWMHENT